MHKLLRYIKGYEKQALLAPLFKMLEACFELFVPLVVASIIDTGIKNADAVFIWQRCGLLVLLAVIGLTCSLTAQYFSAKAALGFGTALRKDLFRHIDTLSYSELDGIGTPTLVTRMTSDINQVQSGVNLTLRLLLRCPFIVIGALIMAASISPRLTLLFVATTLVISLIIWLIMRATVPIYHEAQNGLDRVTLLTRENYVGARVVRAFARQADELAAFVETNDHLKTIQLKAGRISALMNPLTYLVVNLTVIALLLLGGREVNVGNLTQGEVIALINYMSQILINLLRVADLVISVTRALASGMRVNEILNTQTTMSDPSSPELTPDANAPAVDFDHVTFTYRGAGAPSLTDVSFAAQSGQTIGVIGGTGSGKTTLIDLVARFYDVSEGAVRLFGHDVKEYAFAQLRQLIGVVPQQAMLFTGTIRDNMRWAAPNATDEEIWAALEIAQAADFVRGKPGMLDEPVETAGRNFSGGQRQRLTIARALVPRPKILILDDSASALDFATDAALRKALKEKTQGMTVFIVSQRAASVQRADHILVLDDGVLTGDAPHADLLKTCPVYREICLSQLSKEEVEKTL
ncbi:ABC transporter ATP-binding protein [Subdoligranulum variabile]|uniref:ABC transporter, ATP-binding protein n=1 Tax=Subdoligranulum variabile DSM 15176 TaxID=411471 RepID=D1PMW1_9FIRM|nr:ABC transporter ATP-binding protein [Subdoligranulum variabile]EFB75896.1 ABC transporter, ATP-binding protein [Subdoligranulum variabile DSM 15176]UWP68562.1 ABC transporter ATP-binding protein/permease [Subdoligranulum variabile]